MRGKNWWSPLIVFSVFSNIVTTAKCKMVDYSYLFKVNNQNIRKRYEICSKLTVKTPEKCQRPPSGISIVNIWLWTFKWLLGLSQLAGWVGNQAPGTLHPSVLTAPIKIQWLVPSGEIFRINSYWDWFSFGLL